LPIVQCFIVDLNGGRIGALSSHIGTGMGRRRREIPYGDRFLDRLGRLIQDLHLVPTVLIADDHALLRAGLKLTFQLGSTPARVVEAASGHEAVAVAERERPDLAVLDIGMPGLNGLDAAERIRAAVPTCRIVILSMHGDDDRVQRAFRAGVSGYVLKDAPVSELAAAVDAVRRGEKYVSAGISAAVAARVVAGEPLDESPLDLLTPRQREVLQRIAEGNSTKEIAFDLGLSPKTVEIHRRQLMERLQIHDVASLVRFALRAGLIDPA
jgi:DNA-binding NarL/FixJ family response regulator